MWLLFCFWLTAAVVCSSARAASSPPTNARAASPSPTSVTSCGRWSASATSADTINAASCGVIAAGAQTFVVSMCSANYPAASCTGETTIRVFSPGGVEVIYDNTGSGAMPPVSCISGSNMCAQVQYTVPAGAPRQTYIIREGCVGNTACSGLAVVAGSLGVTALLFTPTPVPSLGPSPFPSSVPTMLPTTKAPSSLPTLLPSAGPTVRPLFPTAPPSPHPTAPTMAPTAINTLAPTMVTLCGAWSAKNTNADTLSDQTCGVIASAKQTFVVSMCSANYPAASCTGETTIRVFSPGGVEVIYDNTGSGAMPPVSCISGSNMCAQVQYTVPAGAPRQTYIIREGCVGNTACSGLAVVAGSLGVTALLFTPTPVPSLGPSPLPSSVPTMATRAPTTSQPSREPTQKPTAVPSALPTRKPTPTPTISPTVRDTRRKSFVATFYFYGIAIEEWNKSESPFANALRLAIEQIFQQKFNLPLSSGQAEIQIGPAVPLSSLDSKPAARRQRQVLAKAPTSAPSLVPTLANTPQPPTSVRASPTSAPSPVPTLPKSQPPQTPSAGFPSPSPMPAATSIRALPTTRPTPRPTSPTPVPSIPSDTFACNVDISFVPSDYNLANITAAAASTEAAIIAAVYNRTSFDDMFIRILAQESSPPGSFSMKFAITLKGVSAASFNTGSFYGDALRRAIVSSLMSLTSAFTFTSSMVKLGTAIDVNVQSAAAAVAPVAAPTARPGTPVAIPTVFDKPIAAPTVDESSCQVQATITTPPSGSATTLFQAYSFALKSSLSQRVQAQSAFGNSTTVRNVVSTLGTPFNATQAKLVHVISIAISHEIIGTYVPTPRPSYSPSPAPTAIPCPAGQHRIAGSSGILQTACKACAVGKYSSGNVDACRVCPIPASTAGDGASSIEDCFVTCPPGYSWTTGPQGGSRTACLICGVGFYSANGNVGSCSICPAGRITPVPGATSDVQCLSPRPNFIIGAMALGITACLSLAYVVFGRFHRVSFLRRERIMVPEIKLFNDAMKQIGEREAEMRAEVLKDQLEEQVRNALKETTFFERQLERALAQLKLALFILLAGIILFVGTAASFAKILATVFFYSLVIWKSLHNLNFSIPHLDFADIINLVMETVFGHMPPWLRTFLEAFFLPVLWLFEGLSSIRLDFSTVNVTCQGATAPLELLTNIIVLGAVIIIIETDYQVFRSISFASVTERFAFFASTVEYRSYALKRYNDDASKQTGGPKSSFYVWYSGLLLRTFIVFCIGQIINFQTILTTSMTFIQISSFVQDAGLHLHTEACNSMPGTPYIDTIYAYLTTFLAYVLLVPSVYEIGKILTPGNPFDSPVVAAIKVKITRIIELCDPGRVADLPELFEFHKGREQAFLDGIIDHYYESEEDTKAHSDMEMRKKKQQQQTKRRTTIAYAKEAARAIATETRDVTWYLLRLPVTVLAVDLWIAKAASIWCHFVLHLTKERVHRHQGDAIDKNKADEDGMYDDDSHTHSHSHAHDCFESLIAQIRDQLGIFTTTLNRATVEEHTKWIQRREDHLLPSYFKLLRAEVQEIFPEHDPPSFFVFVFASTCVGHVFTKIGRAAWMAILKKYGQFLLISLGVWTDELLRLHRVEELIEKMTVPNDGRLNMDAESEQVVITQATNRAYGTCLSSIISTRVVLLQIVPQFSVLAMYAIATSSAPLFVSPNCKLYQKLYPPIITDPFRRARQLETPRYKSTNWIIAFSGINIFVTQSRLLQHFVQLFIYILSFTVLMAPTSKITYMVFAAVLVPYCIAQSLILVTGLFKALDLQSAEEEAKANKLRQCILLLHDKNVTEDEIVRILSAFSGEGQEEGLEKYVRSLQSQNGLAANPLFDSDGDVGVEIASIYKSHAHLPPPPKRLSVNFNNSDTDRQKSPALPPPPPPPSSSSPGQLPPRRPSSQRYSSTVGGWNRDRDVGTDPSSIAIVPSLHMSTSAEHVSSHDDQEWTAAESGGERADWRGGGGRRGTVRM